VFRESTLLPFVASLGAAALLSAGAEAVRRAHLG
jgi:hypothetical protein